jgi:hypothetical protein
LRFCFFYLIEPGAKNMQSQGDAVAPHGEDLAASHRPSIFP